MLTKTFECKINFILGDSNYINLLNSTWVSNTCSDIYALLDWFMPKTGKCLLEPKPKV